MKMLIPSFCHLFRYRHVFQRHDGWFTSAPTEMTEILVGPDVYRLLTPRRREETLITIFT